MAAPISVRALAELLGITPRRVQQLAVKGIIPRPERGKYEPISSVQRYCQHLRDISQGQGESSLTEERVLLTRENRMKVARINKILDREFGHIPTLEKIMIKIVTEWNTRLDSVPSKCIAPLELCKSKSEKKEAVERVVDDIRADIRNLDIARILAEACDAGLEVATKAKSKSMGRTVRAPKRGKQRRNG